MMVAKRQPTERQLAALAKAREALIKKHTCERCGDEDPARGLQRQSQDRICDTLHDGVMLRTCISCRIYYHWLDTRARIEQELHTLFAEKTPFYLIDTETTDKLESKNCQAVEIGIIDQDGKEIFHSLCKPDIPMPTAASEIHGITDDQLVAAPIFAEIWPKLVELLTSSTVPIYAWNADFDRQMLHKSAKRFQLDIPDTLRDPNRWRCAMRLHARWYGEWSNGKNDYRWQPLEWACSELEIQDSGRHRAIDDAQNALKVLRGIAERAGKYPPPQDMPRFSYYGG